MTVTYDDAYGWQSQAWRYYSNVGPTTTYGGWSWCARCGGRYLAGTTHACIEEALGQTSAPTPALPLHACAWGYAAHDWLPWARLDDGTLVTRCTRCHREERWEQP